MAPPKTLNSQKKKKKKNPEKEERAGVKVQQSLTSEKCKVIAIKTVRFWYKKLNQWNRREAQK